MNIVVLNAAGHTVVRPDTTLKKSSDDFYAPDFINRVSWSPVLFARISKPGKYIAAKFASRHYDCINYGMLLYPEDFIDGGEDGYARACCFDHTSFLPSPMYNPVTLGREGNRAELRRNGSSRKSPDTATCGPGTSYAWSFSPGRNCAPATETPAASKAAAAATGSWTSRSSFKRMTCG